VAQDFPNGTPRCLVIGNCGRVHVMPFDLFQRELHDRGNVPEVHRKKLIQDAVQNRCIISPSEPHSASIDHNTHFGGFRARQPGAQAPNS
jgi:hypothetical protein